MLRIATAATILITLAACSGSPDEESSGTNLSQSTPKAVCGPGSNPEIGIQGRVSRAEQDNGRAAEGYNCNTEMVGSYAVPNPIGTVGGFQVHRYIDAQGQECAFYDSTLLYPTNLADLESGVNVMDMSDPSNPTLSTRLLTPAMLTPHESLRLNQERGLLVAVAGNLSTAPGIVDIWDVSQDCLNPQFQSSSLAGILGHESGMAPDGNTYYVGSAGGTTTVAVDISNPLLPRTIWAGNYSAHGMTVSDDGNRLYISAVGANGLSKAELIILDVSEIQSRELIPNVTEVARLDWEPVSIPQIAEPFTRDGKAYLFEVDEYGHGSEVGAARIIDIDDETNPKVVSNIRLEVHNPENFDAIADDPGASFQAQGYAAHYCNIPTRVNPTIAACSMIVSGLRVYDIRDPHNPKEIAYFNPPQNARVTPYFEASAWAMSGPAFVPERKEIWYSDGYAGLFVVKLTNDVWPEN
jgi:hypothetical protein